jgi:hypothetical protein
MILHGKSNLKKPHTSGNILRHFHVGSTGYQELGDVRSGRWFKYNFVLQKKRS